MITNPLLDNAVTMLELLGTVSLRVSAALLLVLVVARILGTRHAAWRSVLWRLGVCGSLLIPLCLAFLPKWELPLASPVPVSRAATEWVPEIVVRSTTVDGAGSEPAPAPRVPFDTAIQGTIRIPPKEAPVVLPTVAQSVVLIYGVVLMILLLRTGMAWRVMRRLDYSAVEIAAGPESQRLQVLSDRVGLRRRVRLAVSDFVACPTLVGVLSPAIVLPQRSDTRGVADGVLLHELAHARSRSVLFNLIGRVALAVHWYNPLVWLAVRKERQAGEQVCDDWATALSRDWRGYAHALLEAAASLGPFQPSVAAAHFVRPTGVATRVSRIHQLRDGASPRTGTLRRVMAIGFGVVCVVAMGTTRLQAVSTPPVDLSAHSENWDFVWLPPGVVVGESGHSMNNDGQIAGVCVDGEAISSCTLSPGSAEPTILWDSRSRTIVVSSEGIIAGSADTDEMQLAIPFMWQHGQSATLPTLGGPQTVVTDVNNHGQVVGWASRPGNSDVAFVAWKDSIIEVPTLGGRYANAAAINEDGAIVGSSHREDDKTSPFYWHPDSGIQELYHPPRYTGGAARDISEDGRILVNLHQCDWGDEWDSMDCRVLGQPFVWTFSARWSANGHRRGGYSPLPTPPGYDDIRGRAVNTRGDVLLFARNRQIADDVWVDFLITDGELISLPQPEGGGHMRYYALNDRGWIAGNLTLVQHTDGEEVALEEKVGFIAKPRR